VVNWQVAWSASYALAGVLAGVQVQAEETGVTLGVLNLFIEPGGELALLLCQLGLGSVWSERAPTIFSASVTALLSV
jgi:hypothetical protein